MMESKKRLQPLQFTSLVLLPYLETGEKSSEPVYNLAEGRIAALP